MSNFQVIRRRVRAPVAAITAIAAQARGPLRQAGQQRATLHLPTGQSQ